MTIWLIISVIILLITVAMAITWRFISGGLFLLWASIVGVCLFFVSIAVLVANIILEVLF